MAIFTAGVVPASVLVTGKQPKWLRQWARFARATSFEDLPPEVVERTRLVILDSLGAILAGRAEPELQGAGKRSDACCDDLVRHCKRARTECAALASAGPLYALLPAPLASRG